VAQWSRTKSRLLFEPGDVALDGRGKLYVADGENAWIEVLSSAGKTLERLGSFENPSTGQFAGPAAVAVDSAGFVYVADYTWITKLSPRGVPLVTWGRYGREKGRFELPNGLAVDSHHNVYVSDALMNRIVKLSPDGKTLRRWGSAGHGPGQFEGPTDVAVDTHDNVYVTDFGNHRVEKFSSSGRLLATWK
jgi:DNA-binding beta-propeller fold protein YncE